MVLYIAKSSRLDRNRITLPVYLSVTMRALKTFPACWKKAEKFYWVVANESPPTKIVAEVISAVVCRWLFLLKLGFCLERDGCTVMSLPRCWVPSSRRA